MLNLWRLFTSVFVILQLQSHMRASRAQRDTPADLPVLLWWTPFSDDPGYVQECGEQSCLVTDARSHINSPQLSWVLIYGTLLEPWDLPLPRSARVPWGLLHEESPKNAPIFCHDDCISLFNLTATFRSGSDLPLTLQYLSSLEALTSPAGVVPIEEKLASERAPLVYLASGCDTPVQRDAFVAELMQHIAVDSYGVCLNNRPLPVELADPSEADPAALDAFLAPYRFYLSLENAVCDDYITEKLWRPLRLGVVPVYHGAPNVRRWLPNNDSALLVSEFESPRALAAHLKRLGADSEAYSAHLRHKRGQVDNAELKRTLASRPWAALDDTVSDAPNLVEAFQCRACELAWEARRVGGTAPRTADSGHYGCPRPAPLLADGDSSWWAEQWERAALEAAQMRRLVADGRAVSREDFHRRILSQLSAGRDEL
ncbi:alpha-(1,3)-fucosyltransferase 10-like isoform X2 [Amphibalanus amphitrite]|nr:alpha-(1,3)-fucosyltransferase 10-like isoform X2 [Amphibalanus amphitrite]XP_043210410.1 alpha-(1,3)-fucosyltransferase 10-like isoform X2 [Amphibalanus amphitrite]XP_043210411.1 alpha-(1,3)-fucosyltransferase 10-like isoform X2 [Amphibalanus amphitrite]